MYPLDQESIIEAVAKTGKVLLLNEDNKEGGLLGEVAAIISEYAFFELDAPIVRITGPDIPAMPYSPPMEKFFMPNPEKVTQAIRELAEF